MGTRKQRISLKIQAKSLGDCGFRVSVASESFIFVPRGRGSSYFGLFSILRVVWLSFNALRAVWPFFPKGLFGKLMGYWNSALF